MEELLVIGGAECIGSQSFKNFQENGSRPVVLDLFGQGHRWWAVLPAVLVLDETMTVFGDDYPMADGTCIRDDIHMTGLAQAHFLALLQLLDGGGNRHKLGNGDGYTILQVIATAERIAGVEIPYVFIPLYSGAPAALIESAEKSSRDLGLGLRFVALDSIVETTWGRHRKNDWPGKESHGGAS